MNDSLDESAVLDGDATAPPVMAPTPGAHLKAAREARGMSATEVAQVIRFSVRQIEALERDDYSVLPGATAVRGFVRSYAKLLRLDAAPLLAALDDTLPSVAPDVRPPTNMGHAEQTPLSERIPRRLLAALGLLVLVVLAAFWYLTQPASTPTKSTSEGDDAATLARPAPTVVPTAEPAAAPAAPADPVAAGMPGNTPAAAVMPAPAVAPTAPAAPSAPVAPVATVTPAPATAATPVVAAPPRPPVPPVASPAPAASGLLIEFDDRSWIEVRDAARKVVLAGEFPAGTKRTVDGRAPFQLWIGKASAVRVSHGERRIDLRPYTREEVARLTVE